MSDVRTNRGAEAEIVFFDTNVLIDVIAQRPEHFIESQLAWSAAEAGQIRGWSRPSH